ncbi:hypothetical protein [Devriesea agamarum]|uniref:hypothetical protein n=1 Tax=Devriesea agamarum TaxID=472569 RepID=UPI00071D3810|nr:hypothetical protein [Devriesea agamarum]
MTSQTDYQVIRQSTAVHPIETPLVRIVGDERLDFCDALLSRSSEFMDPDTTHECLALTSEGEPFAIFAHLELTDESWLLARTPVSADEVQDYLSDIPVPDGVIWEVSPSGWGAVAFQGPSAWKVAQTFLDFDIAGLPLHGITDISLPESTLPESASPETSASGSALSAPGGCTGDTDARAHLVRISTTGEYGYVLLSNAPHSATAIVTERARQHGGDVVGIDGLARVEAEAGVPYYRMGVHGLNVNQLDLSWMVDWKRLGDFRGSQHLTPPTQNQAKLVPLVAATGTTLPEGTPVCAGEEGIGEIVYQSPSANPDEELFFAVVEAPFWVPGLDLTATGPDGDQGLITVSLPRVLSRSATEPMG